MTREELEAWRAKLRDEVAHMKARIAERRAEQMVCPHVWSNGNPRRCVFCGTRKTAKGKGR